MMMTTAGRALMVVLVAGIAFAACQGSEPATPPAAAAPAPQPPPPPAPPVTSLGRLVNAETSGTFKARIQYLTTRGLKSGVEEQKAETGKTFVVLHFEDRPEQKKEKKESGLVTLSSGSDGRLQAADKSEGGAADVWLTDASGAKYSEWMSLFEKTAGAIAFEVPSTASGFVLHDGPEKSHALKLASQ